MEKTLPSARPLGIPHRSVRSVRFVPISAFQHPPGSDTNRRQPSGTRKPSKPGVVVLTKVTGGTSTLGFQEPLN